MLIIDEIGFQTIFMIAGQKNHLGRQIVYTSLVPPKNGVITKQYATLRFLRLQRARTESISRQNSTDHLAVSHQVQMPKILLHFGSTID